MKRVFILFMLLISWSGFSQNDWEAAKSQSAIEFDKSMTDQNSGGILLSNFSLKHWTYKFTNENEFKNLIKNRFELRAFIANRVLDIGLGNPENDKKLCFRQKYFLERSWVEEENNGRIAGYLFAVTFFRIDEDNWFSFNSVHERTTAYLDSRFIEFRLYKGFKHNGTLATNGIAFIDLPVVINKEEKTITIWSGELFD